MIRLPPPPLSPFPSFPFLSLIFLDVIASQIVDDKYNEVTPGTQGRVFVRVKPYCPVGMFTRYVVS